MPSKPLWKDEKQLLNIVADCLKRIVCKGYRGFDPADLMHSKAGFVRRRGSWALRFLTVVNFYSPINLRPFLKIEEAENSSAMAVLGSVFIKMYTLTGNEEWLNKVSFIVGWLESRAKVVDGTMGWSRTIDYQAGRCCTHGGTSTLTFINAKAAELFLDHYELTGDRHSLELVAAVCRHLTRYTKRISRGSGICLSYAATHEIEIYNASILAGQVLNRYSVIREDRECMDLSMRILEYALERQHRDGSWYYSIKKDGREKKQIDFHQVYMLDGIKKYKRVEEGRLRKRAVEAFSIGTQFYLEKLFDRRMYPYWRYPLKFPIDIHNVSHGVYFLSKYLPESPEYKEKLLRLVEICTTEFYDRKRKFFYYQKYPLFTVRHDFFRWNTTWALYGLVEYLHRFEIVNA